MSRGLWVSTVYFYIIQHDQRPYKSRDHGILGPTLGPPVFVNSRVHPA